jgi:hypothetical protein
VKRKASDGSEDWRGVERRMASKNIKSQLFSKIFSEKAGSGHEVQKFAGLVKGEKQCSHQG